MAVKIQRKRREGVAVIASAFGHVVVIAFLVSQAAPRYVLPEPPEPPMDVQIVTAPDIPPPPITPPKMTPRKIVTATATPPTPAPPLPVPKPTPAPPKPLPAKPEPPKAAPVVTPPATQKPSPPSAVPAPAKLNIHKPKEEAPAGVATLPMAPSPTPARSAPGAPAAGVQTPGSRLSGLIPYPPGSMPSGGSGLRGTLVGCANADSVHLSSVERAHCNERFGVEIDRAPKLDGIPPAKRAAFDKAAAAQDRSLHAGAIDPMRAMEAKHGRPSDFGGGVVTGPASTYVKPGPN